MAFASRAAARKIPATLRHVGIEQSWLAITTDRHVRAAAAMLTVLGRYLMARSPSFGRHKLASIWLGQCRRVSQQVVESSGSCVAHTCGAATTDAEVRASRLISGNRDDL